MLIELLGSLVITVSGGLAGRTLAANFQHRPLQLRVCQQGLQMLETEITYAATPLPEAWEHLAKLTQNPMNRIYSTAYHLYLKSDGVSATEVWEGALEQTYEDNALTKADLEILTALGTALGTSYGDDQVKHLRLAINKLQQQEVQAWQEAAKNVKQWRYLGFLGGLMLTLLII